MMADADYVDANDGQFDEYAAAADNCQFIDYVGTSNGHFIDYVVTNNGEIIVTTEDTLVGPGQPEMAMNAAAYKIGQVNSDENVKDDQASRKTFKYPQAEQKSLLLTVPPEIRNAIFKLCLCHPENIGEKLWMFKKKVECFTMATPYEPGVAIPKLQEAYELSISRNTKQAIKEHSLRNLALMRTCQSIYNEAAQVFWGQRFTFRTNIQLQNFLLSPDMRHDLVRDVRILKMDYKVGVNYMPGICVLIADKLTGLEVFDVDMGHMRYKSFWSPGCGGFRDDEHIKKAAENLGFGIYSCMHPWVTKVVREQGIDKLMTILQIVRETDPILPDRMEGNPRVFHDFRGRGPLTETQREMADTVTAEEILRQIDLYEKKF